MSVAGDPERKEMPWWCGLHLRLGEPDLEMGGHGPINARASRESRLAFQKLLRVPGYVFNHAANGHGSYRNHRCRHDATAMKDEHCD